MSIAINPLRRDATAEVAHLQLPPAQRGYVGPITEMTADFDPLIDVYVVHYDAENIGFFKIDLDFSRHDTRLPAQALGMRGLLIGGQYQRHGHGAALLEILPAELAKLYPDTTEVFLRVDASNTPAIRAYLAHGWVQTDLPATDGHIGPELTFSLILRGQNA